MPESIALLPGQGPAYPDLLARYLPPIPAGVAGAWLAENISPGGWVLDPFGAAPQLAAEAARAGYRVLVAANNPIARFLLELAARPPAEGDLRSALADLAATRKGAERLEPYIRSLYATKCEQCGGEVTAEAFLWEREAAAPYGKIYHCTHCGETGEHTATKADQEKAAYFAAGGLHQARALERIAPKEDPDRSHAEEALSTYLPRAIYALFTLINKLEALPSGTSYPRRRELTALLLHALDQGNTLWPYPTARARPRALTIPRRFRENNIWFALEEAARGFAGSMREVPLTSWPELPPLTGGIAMFEGRLKGLGELVREEGRAPDRIEAVLAALPRPNQAFWTLSALWAGWIWGREAIGPFKSVLRRRRYDWAWHSTAMHAALANLAALLPEETRFLGLVGEAEPGFLSSAIVAAAEAGFALHGLALRAEGGQAQLIWTSPSKATRLERAGTVVQVSYETIALQAAQEHLRQRGEPAPYLPLHTAALCGLADQAALSVRDQAAPAETYARVQEACEQVFTFRHGFLRFGGSDRSLDVGQWWLREAGRTEIPLADRVEMAVVRYLQEHPGSTLAEVDAGACKALPGLLTPGVELVAASLESYGELERLGGETWRLRAQDAPAARRSDLSTMRKALEQTGRRLGFNPLGDQPLIWQEAGGKTVYAFYILASAIFGEAVFSNPFPAEKSLIVLPGARAPLAVLKLKRDPRLRQAVEAGWRFLKFRHLRLLSESPSLSPENLAEQLTLDPLTDAAEQMRLF